jgi:diguanylate cyclase (GGDEF)-like protein
MTNAMSLGATRASENNRMAMFTPADTPLSPLQVAAAAHAVAAASLTGFGLRYARQRGWRWWLAAAWLAALGATLAAASAHVLARILAEALLLQWPLTLLIGLRRFHARDALPLHASVDFALALAVVPVLAVSFVAARGIAPWVGAGAASLALLYAALVALRTPPGHATPPLRVLAAAQCLLAFMPLAALASGAPAEMADPLALRTVSSALGLTVAAFVLLTMVGLRTEQQLRASRQRLRTLANVDALTQIPNRRHFHELAGEAVVRDAPGSAVLLMFDVDHFKGINDSLGHAAGDRALMLVAGSMTEHLRERDIAGRLGGDEFALLLRGADARVAVGVAARIVLAVQRRAAENQLPPITLSFGVVQVLAAERLEEALRRADQALFEAKRQGRSCAITAVGDEAHPVFSESQPLGLAGA